MHNFVHHQDESPCKKCDILGWTKLLALLNKLHTRQIYLLLVYPQAPLEYNLFMKLPTILRIKGVNQKTRYLQLLKNSYRKKQAGRVRKQYLVQGVLNICFKQSDIDKCAFYQDSGLSFFLCLLYMLTDHKFKISVNFYC